LRSKSLLLYTAMPATDAICELLKEVTGHSNRFCCIF